MKILTNTAIHLLHESAHGSLATHSLRVPGFPFASVLNHMPDSNHDPVFLISSLAEHTRNLRADGRASLLVLPPEGGDVMSNARLTLIGEVRELDSSPALVARYRRYHPSAERYLALGDFSFFRLEVRQVRYVAGFGSMGWLDGEAWHSGAAMSAEDEEILLGRLQSGLPEGARLLGTDAWGLDMERDGKRLRLPFPDGQRAPGEMEAGVRGLLSLPG